MLVIFSFGSGPSDVEGFDDKNKKDLLLSIIIFSGRGCWVFRELGGTL